MCCTGLEDDRFEPEVLSQQMRWGFHRHHTRLWSSSVLLVYLIVLIVHWENDIDEACEHLIMFCLWWMPNICSGRVQMRRVSSVCGGKGRTLGTRCHREWSWETSPYCWKLWGCSGLTSKTLRKLGAILMTWSFKQQFSIACINYRDSHITNLRKVFA